MNAARVSAIKCLVAGRVGVISASCCGSPINSVCTGGRGTHANGDTRARCAAHWRAIDVMHSGPTYANPTPPASVREGVG